MASKERVLSDFCFLNGREDARLSDVERLTLVGGGSLDRAVLRLSKGLSTVNLAQVAPNLDFRKLRAQREQVLALRQSGVLEEVLQAQPSHLAPTTVQVHGFPQGGVFDLSFQSIFPPVAPFLDKAYMDFKENQSSCVRLWEHSDSGKGERQTIVAIHGWTMGDQRVNSLAFLPGLFFSLGWNVALVELPFHGRRQPPASNGHSPLFPSADPVRTFVAVAHAIHDLRQLSSHLRNIGHTRFSCVALRLGAYVGQLWCALERLEKGVFIVPLVSMGDLVWDTLKGHPLGEGAPAPHEGRSFFRDLFRDHCALGRVAVTPQSSLLTLGGRGDQVVSRGQMDLLRRHWPESHFVWLSGGHGAHLRRGETFARMREFLEPLKQS